MVKIKDFFGRRNKDLEKRFIKQSLQESLQGLSKIMLNGNHPSCQVTEANTLAVIKKNVNNSSEKTRGGIIVFPASFTILGNDFIYQIKNYYYHSPNMDVLRVGKYFAGYFYVFAFKEKYNQSSWSIELLINTTGDLESIAEELAITFELHSVVIWDYSDNKIYLYNERVLKI